MNPYETLEKALEAIRGVVSLTMILMT